MESLPTDLPGDKTEDKIEKVAEATLAQISPPELERFDISFSEYIEHKCKVNVMSGDNAQIALKIVRDIGLDFKSPEYFSTRHTNGKLQIRQVYNLAPYDEYYRKLPDEIIGAQEVKEIKYVDQRNHVDLRIFYYTLSSKFYMLAITGDTHENLDHKTYRGEKIRYKHRKRF